MYRINKIIENCDGCKIEMYGIENDSLSYTSLTSNKDKIISICELCNELELDEVHLKDIIDDMIIH